MKNATSSLIVCVFFLASCASYNQDAFLRKQPISQSLPPMTPIVIWDQYGFNDLGENVREVMAKSYIASFNDPTNMQSPDSRCGFVVFNLELVDQSAGFVWLVPIIATLGTSFLLGIPAGSQTAETKVQVDILDANLNKISSFEAKGKGTAYGALYWGYNAIGAANYGFGFTCTDVSITKSFMAAFDVLIKKMAGPSEIINSKLAAAGPNTLKSYQRLDNIYAGWNVFKADEATIWDMVKKQNTKEAYNVFTNLFPKSTLNK